MVKAVILLKLWTTISSSLSSLSGVTTVSWCRRVASSIHHVEKVWPSFLEWRYRSPLHQRNSFGKRRNIRYWQITTDKVELQRILLGLLWLIWHPKSVGNTYGLRTWIEYGFKQVKDELGWADYRLTSYEEIDKWWEIVCSACLMVSLQSSLLNRQINKPVLISRNQK